jgi:hypothetical protein
VTTNEYGLVTLPAQSGLSHKLDKCKDKWSFDPMCILVGLLDDKNKKNMIEYIDDPFGLF